MLYRDIYSKLGISDTITEKYKKVIQTVVDIIIDPVKHKQEGQVTVVPLETGGGKSSITNLTLAWLSQNNFLNSGTIILKERIVDCDDTVRDINSIVGKDVAIAYHNRIYQDPDNKKRYLKESEVRSKLFRYPILVMTHEGFKRRLKKLGDFIYWTDDKITISMDNANKYLTRTRLIVDEQPSLMDTYQITNKKINDIEAYIQKLGNRNLMEEILKICGNIKNTCFLKRADLETQYWYRCDFKFSEKFEDVMLTCRTDTIKETYSALKIFCEEGGFVSYGDDESHKHITVARYVDIFDPLFNAIILDGTGRINAVYKNEYFNVVDIPQIKTYSNTSIYICRQLNGSRSEISSNKEILKTALNYAVDKTPNGELCLIITHKEFEEYFKNIEVPDNIKVNHFGNITGTNEYRNFKYGFYIGTPFMYDNAYKLAFHIYNKDKNYNRTHKVVTIKGVRKMVDKDYNDTKAAILAVELIQAINRLRCRNWDNGDTLETFSLILNKDNDVIDLVKQGMPNVNIIDDEDFYQTLPQSIRDKKPEDSTDILLRLIHKSKNTKEKISKGKLLDMDEKLAKLGHSRRAELWNSPSIQQLIEDKIINISGRMIEFL